MQRSNTHRMLLNALICLLLLFAYERECVRSSLFAWVATLQGTRKAKTWKASICACRETAPPWRGACRVREGSYEEMMFHFFSRASFSTGSKGSHLCPFLRLFMSINHPSLSSLLLFFFFSSFSSFSSLLFLLLCLTLSTRSADVPAFAAGGESPDCRSSS
ncbi:putative transmembrane protein [Toxoplasma gondii FOU]|uniref:Putative transmembrane protein n=3 Tax=Toxoplasma gondii TaxID=5811 RepID=A0A086JZA0_TOXGO|nr:putative transmembrane protein [Toxoplasma gondii FOU]PUA84956.1 putative transmembrane protein [Toxoplasma gondii TgCATBr9]RQX68384.1 putative transmembrane protein [Toxoplasma gondii CAST]